jgi:hypothetical protein
MKRLSLFPFLFILYVILSPLGDNFTQLDAYQALRPLLLLTLAVGGGLLLLYILFRVLFRDWEYASYLVFMITLYFFGFGYLNRFLQDTLANYGIILYEKIALAIFTGVFLILLVKPIWTRLGGRQRLVTYLNLVMLLLLIFPMFELLSGVVNGSALAGASSEPEYTNVGDLQIDCSHTPDIYYIVLDGYGRGDMLAELFAYDNQPFLDELEGKGFFIADESYTNYIHTLHSIPSSFIFDFVDPPEGGAAGRKFIKQLMREKSVMAVLDQCGYQTISIKSGYYLTNQLQVDLNLERGLGASEFENLLLADTPLDVMSDVLNMDPPEHSYEGHRQRVLYSFNQLAQFHNLPGPKFVFAHILTPHPPFVFDRYGNPTQPDRSYYLGDAEDYKGELDEYLAGYPEQMRYINRKLIQMIDSILEGSSSPPIIILQGDHGPGSRLFWDKPLDSCLWERTAILNAYHLPGEGANALYPSISPVNSFRVVLNEYFGADLPLLPDNTYFSFHKMDRPEINITAHRTSRANCDLP